MKKIRLLLILMTGTILVLAGFEGYWLHKLYKDEYRDLRKEVDVSFRETMNKLQVSRFEKDTFLVKGFSSTASIKTSSPTPSVSKGTLNISRVENLPAAALDEAKGEIVATTVPFNNLAAVNEPIANRISVSGYGNMSNSVQGKPAVGTIPVPKTTTMAGLVSMNIHPDSIESIAIRSGYSFKGAPNPAILEMILKSQLSAKDTSRRVFIRMDTAASYSSVERKKYRPISIQMNVSDTMKFSPLKQELFKLIIQENDKQKLSNLFSLLKKDSVDTSQIAAIRVVRNVPVNNTDVVNKNNLTITTNIVPRAIVKAQGSPVINFLSNNKTINDSIPVNQVDSAYRVELLKANRNIPFRILFYSYQDSLAKTRIAAKKDTLSDVFSEQVITGFKVPYSYQATFNQTMPYVLSKMRMQIGGSVILLLLVTISFIVLYRNMMAQHRLAVMKNDFISNITHELKTPIATVGVAIEALKNFDAIKNPERTKEYLDISASELQRLSLLVDKVLKLSMFEKKQLELNKEPFDLKELLTETMAIMRLQFEKHKAAVSFVCEEGSYMLEADKLHITSVIYNLLDNALKYSPGKPAIQVKLSAVNEHQLQLDIIDNGMGIASQHQSRIFEKFFRVPTGNQHNIKGYGLGLSYVAEVVKSHNGSIRLHSEEGKGSTFSILLPAYSS